ncbi:hypothetical protein QBC38DRAFT_251282 [Podospora fimiseda]|uniref:FAD-binding domain-containing protein n=1 Tax=Podospora fimiseda TaxID=252190 RepID=A0AAN7BM91_9PEZI|nr:hypothetical protein QBC38DRAFT_251282 [Podospora fimiseda]
MSCSPTPLRILITGFGISGPAFALSLINLLPPSFPLSIRIVERAPHLRNTGQQVDVRGQGLTAMRGLSPTLETNLRKKLVKEPGLEFIDYKRGNRIAWFGVNDTGKGGQGFTAEWEVMRGDVVDVLREELEEKGNKIVKWEFEKWVEGLTQVEGTGEVKVKFNDGEEGVFDLAVGADGLRSKMRKLVFGGDVEGGGSSVELKKIGMTLALFSVPSDRQKDGRDARWCLLPGNRTIMTRRDREDCLRVCLGFLGEDKKVHEALKSGTVEEQKKAWAEKFAHKHWISERVVDALLNSEEAKNDFWTQELVQVKAKSWSNKEGNVVLLGDSAYCPSPLSGAGVSCAFVGAYVLSNEIAKVCRSAGKSVEEAKKMIPEGLKVYETKVRPFTDIVQKRVPSERMMRFFIAGSEFGVRAMNRFVWAISAFKIDKVAGHIFSGEDGDNYGNWKLPQYGTDNHQE